MRIAALVTLFIFGSIFSAPYLSAQDQNSQAQNNLDMSARDGAATIHKVTGYAVLTKMGNPIEKDLKVGDVIQSGDQIQTGTGSALTIYFDKSKQNAIRIPAETSAVFTSIEPTSIELKSGSVFNVVDGLANGSSWKVTTPSAVAAVRGTVFMITFIGGKFYAATLNVPNDGKTSAIEVTSIADESKVNVFEGKEVSLEKTESLSIDKVVDLHPETVSTLQSFFQEVQSERHAIEEQDGGSVPEPLAEFTETTCDASGKNCSTKTCKQTSNGEVCTYA